MSSQRLTGVRHGFTLIELLVALAISALVMAAIFRVSMDQQKVHISQNQVTELQQKLRAATDLLAKDIRMAGYNPRGAAPDAGCATAISILFHFKMDLNDDGSCSSENEDVVYTLKHEQGHPDKLTRKNSPNATPITILDSVDGLEFNYILADGSETTAPSDLSRIRSVEVSLLVRTGVQDKNYTDTKAYITGSGVQWGPYNDHYRRRFVCLRILCQNLGL